MTVTAVDVPRLGSTEARVFTPPLETNLIDEYWKPYNGCSHTHLDGLTCETSWGYDCIDFLEGVCGWELLPWQKWLYIHALEKRTDGTGFRFPIVVITVARQNGKTQWLKGLGLWRLFLNEYGKATPRCPAAKLAVIAAQNLDYAEGMLREVVEEVRENAYLRRELINHKETNGKHRMLLSGRRNWRAATAGRRGARSLSVDLAFLDELREHLSWDAWRAIVPTTTARPYSQVVCASNAGDARSIVLRAQKDQATRKISRHETGDSRIGYFEWSVPMEVDPHDPSYWYLANPSMGYLPEFELETLLGYLEAQQFSDMPGFRTEHLCQWVDTLQPGVIPAEHWEATLDGDSEIPLEGTVYAAVDVNYKRTKSYISVAGRRSDGLLHFEVVAAARGTDWIIPWFRERAGKFEAVAVQVRGAPASDLVNPMKAAGIPVLEWGGTELVTGTSRFFDYITHRTARHRPQPVLDRAASGTVSRNLGDAIVLDRRNSPVDAAPLIACAAACWAESVGPPVVNKGAVYGWDEDEIARWEKEAEEGDIW